MSDNTIMEQNKVTPRRPAGFVEYLPKQQAVLQKMLDSIRTVFEVYGFLPIETPAVELAEVLLAKGGGETEKEIYRFSKGEKNYALHYDLTVPLARYVAEHESELSFPFRRYQMQKVWRAERSQKGRYREFYQCDADIIGSTSMGHDAELVSLVVDLFSTLNLGSFKVKINNRKLITGYIESLDLNEKNDEILHAIDKLEKVGPSAVLEMLKNIDLTQDQANAILEFVGISGASSEVMAQLDSLAVDNQLFRSGLLELKELLSQVEAQEVDSSCYTIDLKIVRGLDYYTGTVYETVIDAHPEFGSVCSGGRYDNLAQYYTNTHLPGVGISVGLTRLFALALESGLLKAAPSNVSAYIVNFGSGARDWALKVASELRSAGVATQVNLEDSTNPAKQLKQADRLGARYAIVIGEAEVKSNHVVIKDMKTGIQETLSPSAAVVQIKNNINI